MTDSVTQSKSEVNARLVKRAVADPIYGSAYAIHGSVDRLLDAGFFDDEKPDGEANTWATDDWLMTPTHKIVERLNSLPDQLPEHCNLYVLVCTGAYCPIHEGHVEQLDIAKEHLERQGNVVLGGYLSISHDMYVSRKCGQEALSGSHRLRLCQEAAAESSWIMGDGWEGLGTERALNFSDVMLRLESYLARNVKSPRPIEVVYVFGSDHARFSAAFLGKGRCVCTLRPGYEDNFYHFANQPGIKGNERITFAPGQERTMSSSAVRGGETQMMVERARRVYIPWMDRLRQSTSHEVTTATRAPVLATYHLRDEGDWAIANWLTGRDATALSESWKSFRDPFITLLRFVHLQAQAPDCAYDVQPIITTVSSQRDLALQFTDNVRVISLDPCVEGEFNLEVCRGFQLSDACNTPTITARPDSRPLAEQVKDIPAGHWTLLDDDIATGRTMRSVQQMLPEHVHIDRFCALTQKPDSSPVTTLDILDCRDFLAGARQAGLVVTLPNGEPGRAPYCLPYVSPADRASIPLSREMEFSQEVWALNRTFYENVEPPILLGETNSGFQALMRTVGFDYSTPMAEICAWHRDTLHRLITSAQQALAPTIELPTPDQPVTAIP